MMFKKTLKNTIQKKYTKILITVDYMNANTLSNKNLIQ